jgi:8-oxo-dGTP pyrophosphatase MutT (NUDIX family)
MICLSSSATPFGSSCATCAATCCSSALVSLRYPSSATGGSCPEAGSTRETYVQTAVRELREEAGIHIGPEQIRPPTWRRTASFRHRDTRRLQHEVIAVVCLDALGPDVDQCQRLDYEKEDYIDFRWMPVADIVTSTERFYPGRLPELLPDLLAGKAIDEPFELWS